MAAEMSWEARIIMQNLGLCAHSGMALDKALALLADDSFRAVPFGVRKLAASMAKSLGSGMSLGEVMEKSGKFPAELCLFMRQHYAGSITAEALEAFQEYYNSTMTDAASLWKSLVYPLIDLFPVPFIILSIVCFVQPQFEAIVASANFNMELTLAQLITKFASGLVIGFFDFFSSGLDAFLKFFGTGDAWLVEPLSHLWGSFFSLLMALLKMIFFFIILLPFLGLLSHPIRSFYYINNYMFFYFPFFKNFKNLRRAILFSQLAEALRHKGASVRELDDFLRQKFFLEKVFDSDILRLRWKLALTADDFTGHFAEFRTVCREKIVNSVVVLNSILEPLSIIIISLVVACLVMSVFDYINMMLQFCLSI